MAPERGVSSWYRSAGRDRATGALSEVDSGRHFVTAQPEIPQLIPDRPAKSVSMTADAMRALLRRHYLPDESRPAGIFAPEIQAPGPTQRKADLIWLGCTAATGRQLIGHEIKVSRGDLLAELADLTKSDPWERYCDRWYLVVPGLSLIEGLELPGSWGVMLPPSGRRTRSMTVHRLAPPLKPDEQSPALRTVASWVHWQLRDTRNQAVNQRRDLERARAESQELRVYSRDARDPNREVVDRVIRGLGGAWGADKVGSWKQQVRVDDVIAALQDLGAVYGRRDEALRALAGLKQALEASQSRITHLLGEMGSAS